MIRTDLEVFLSKELKNLLGLEADFSLDPNVDFSQYGMNSIVSARYTHLLSEAFNVDLSPKQIVDYSTIGKLAEHLTENYADKLSGHNVSANGIALNEPVQAPAESQAPQAAAPEENAQAISQEKPESETAKAQWVQKIMAQLKQRIAKAENDETSALNSSRLSRAKNQGANEVASKKKQSHKQPNPGLDFSFIFFSTNNNQQVFDDKYEYVKNIAKFADANGFKALWMPERHFYEFGGIFPQPAVLLSNIAAETNTIRLRSGSVILPLHHPANVVESWAVLDNLSNGRVDMGFASGWNPNDFVVSPDTFDNLRDVWFSRMEEVEQLWRGDTLKYLNGKGEPAPIRVFPRPLQEELNMWVTVSGNPETFKEAGKRGYNVLTMLTSKPIEELAENIQVYRQARADAGFDPETGVISLMLHSYVHEDESKVEAAVNEHYFDYIKSGLIGHMQAREETPTEEEINRVVEHSFHFQKKNSALFGNLEHCEALLAKMHSAGVNEIACLVDFGISEAQMYETLPYLTQLKDRMQPHSYVPPVSLAQAIKRASATQASAVAQQEFAIVGLAGRYPKASNIDEFWQNLTNNVSCISEIQDRYDWQAIYGDPKKEVGKTNIKHFGLMDDVFHFDSAFFSISKREGEVMDPHARLLLEAAWQCIENAGYAPKQLHNSKTGVFLAFYNSEYGNLLAQMDIEKSSEPYISTALSGTIKANRISYILGLKGPSEVYDTACSSGLVAMHRAMQSINAGDCDQALVGGVSLLLTPDRVVSLSKMGILNESGVCNPFSFPANKEVIGEGVGCILVKPLASAEAAGDHIYAVVCGSDVNHHGDASGRLTMPSAKAIGELMAKTYTDLGVNRDQLVFIEGHGSGNDSDAVELMALRQCIQQLNGYEKANNQPDSDAPIYVGSVKSNIGFGEASGGIAQLTKMALSLNYKLLPATLNFDAVDPSVDLSDTPLAIQTQNVSLDEPANHKPHYASVIAYGLGGTNAHIVLRDYQSNSQTKAQAKAHTYSNENVPFVLSGKNHDELLSYAQSLFSHLSNNAAQKRYESSAPNSQTALLNIAQTLMGRDRLAKQRVVFLAPSYGALLAQLKQFIELNQAGTNTNVQLSQDAWVCSAHFTDNAAIVSDEAIENLLAKRDVASLAQAWVQGNKVDWLALFEHKPYQKVALPPAPFTRIELKLPMMPVQEKTVSGAHWLASRMSVEQTENAYPEHAQVAPTRVRIRLQANDYFVQQHVVDGTPVLPAAGYLAVLGEVAQQVFKRDVCCVKNLAFLMPFELPQGATASELVIEFEANGQFRCYQQALNANLHASEPSTINTEEAAKLCCKGQWVVQSQAVNFAPRVDVNALTKATEIASESAFWDMMNAPEAKQSHGANMRRLQALHVLPSLCVAKLAAEPQRLPLQAAPFLDSAFAASVGFAIARQDEMSPSVPFSIEACYLLSPITSGTALFASVSEREGKLTRYDISIEDANGKVYAVIQGYFAKSFEQLPVAAVQSSSVSAPAHIPAQKPAPVSQAATPTVSSSNHPTRVGDTVTTTSLSTFLIEQFRTMIANFLKLDIDEVPVDEGLEHLGMDSIAVNELTEQANQSISIDMPATLMFEYTCIKDMAEFLAEEYQEELMQIFGNDLGVNAESKTEAKAESKPEPQVAAAPEMAAMSIAPAQSGATASVAVSQTVAAKEVTSHAAEPKSPSGEVAVVGVGGLYPGADNAHDFWEKLRKGEDLITEIPASRRHLVYALFEEDMTELKGLYGGFVEHSDYFDPTFFGLSEEEALAMDPQQRLFLVASWQAIEDAGYYPLSFSGKKIGVYAGAIACEYLHLVSQHRFDSQFVGTGCAISGIANRTSYFLDVNGPSQTLDSACCSSLYAVDRAVIDINAGVIDAAIAGGVSYICTPDGFNAYLSMDYLSDDFRCKAFAANGDGWSKGELFAAVFLKPYVQAQQDNDHIYAVIKATGTNHGGRSHFYEQPNSNKHAELITSVYRKAKVDPRQVVHIEAHGTGTEMGDALEFNVISKSLKELAKAQQLDIGRNYCGLGSIKSNVGHSEAAAGIAGFIKTVMMLHHKTIAPTLHVDAPNQHIRLQKSPLYIATETRPVVNAGYGEESIASVHSFNFSGAAAHVVLASHSAPQAAVNVAGLTRFPVCLSAKTPSELLAYVRKLSDFVSVLDTNVDANGNAYLASLVMTLNRSKSYFEHRLAWTVSSISELQSRLQQAQSLFVASTVQGAQSEQSDAVQINPTALTASGFQYQALLSKSAKKVAEYPALVDANVDGLISLWLSQPNFDWNLLIAPLGVAKMALPTYPFNLTHSYLPPDKRKPKLVTQTLPTQAVVNASAPAPRPVSQPTALAQPTAQVAAPVVRTSAKTPVNKGHINAFVKKSLAMLFDMSPADVDLNMEMHAFPFDSLGIVTLSEGINREFGLESTPPDFFAFVELKDISEFIEEQLSLVSENDTPVAENNVEATPSAPPSRVTPVATPVQAQAAIGEVNQHTPATQNLETANDSAVAIIGVSGAFPKANNLDEFWDVLSNGKDCMAEVPDDRWDWQAMWGDPSKEANKCNVKWAGFIDDAFALDSNFFEISPREATLMDPQQRLLLTHAWKVVEDAGYAPSSLAKSNTAVFVGIATNGFDQVLTDAGLDIDGHSATGLSASIGANRISYFMDLHGPSESIDTACSSSLVAIHRAARVLRNKEAPLAIAGGVNVLVNGDIHASLNRAGMLSLDGRCATFSDKANGYARGEGVGLVLLKPLTQAQADGDHIYGVIRGSAENHGGRANSLTAPNPKAQAALLTAAYQDAGVDPASVSFIETHGTGTELGDPIEINALKSAFASLLKERSLKDGTTTSATAHIALGAVKSNIGHLEVAAGVAGFIKVLLQFKHQTLAKNLHCDTVNPYIRLQQSPFYVLQEQKPWTRLADAQGNAFPLRAGVSSFGFGGANAHVVLEEYIAPAVTSAVNHAAEIILLSAKTEAQLREQVQNLHEFVSKQALNENTNHLDFASLAYTLRVGRDEMRHRLAFVANDLADLQHALEHVLQNDVSDRTYYQGEVGSQDELLQRFTDDSDFSELLSKWLAANKTDKLLSLWAKGLDIPWQHLANSTQPLRRMSLPTYPFSKKAYLPAAKGLKVKGVKAKEAQTSSATSALSVALANQHNPVSKGDDVLAVQNTVEQSAPIHAQVGVTAASIQPVNKPKPKFSLGAPSDVLTSQTQPTSSVQETVISQSQDKIENTAQAQPQTLPEATISQAPATQVDVDSLAAQLAEGLAQALYQDVEDIEQDKSFVELGLDSILAVEWVRWINQHFHIDFPVMKLYDHPNIHALAQFIAGLIGSSASAVVDANIHTHASSNAALTQPASPTLVEPVPEPVTEGASESVDVNTSVTASVNADDVQSQLQESLAEALYVDADDIDLNKPFNELGLDSIIAVEWVRSINQDFGLAMPVTKIYDYPTISALTQFVAGEASRVGAVAGKSNAGALTEEVAAQPVDMQTAITQAAAPIEKTAVEQTSVSAPESATMQTLPQGPNGLVISSVHTLDEIAIKPWQIGALKDDEITLEVKASAINFPDTMCVNGLYPTLPAYPFVPGFEVAGVITQVGAKVTKFNVGDAVIAITGENLGGHAQFVNVLATSAVRKPRNISFEQACSLPVVFGTVFCAFEMAKLQSSDSVLIQTATGGCGLMALQLANLIGCERFATTSKANKMQILAQLGVPHILNYQHKAGELPFDEQIAQITQGKGVDVVLNMLSGEAIQRGINCLAESGRYLELAVHGLKTSGKLDLSRLVSNQQFLSMDFRKLALTGGGEKQQVMDIMVDMVEAQLIVPIVSRVYPYAAIQDALKYVSQGEHIGKVVISHQATQMQDCTQECIAMMQRQRQQAKPDLFESNTTSSHQNLDDKRIAVIGMAGQFPQSPDLDAFWDNIASGKDCISKVPPSRWSINQYYDADPQAPGKSNCQWMGVLDNVDKFDPLFFAISPAEAKFMDPQQRLFLQACWHCIEDAAINPDTLSGKRVGVFVGCTTGQYGDYEDTDGLSAQGLMGGNPSILTSRISYFLNLKGPSIAIDTACSASLVAIAEAANNLLLGQCEMALAGGVSVICGPSLHVMTTKAGMLSADGRCFTFDNRANGFVPGEGVGVVLLKRYAQALADGDPIHGIMAGWGVNQDGKTNGITAPSAASQSELEQQVYREFGISPDSISLVEAHGTGTKLGDPIEVEALKESYAAFTQKQQFCALGSVKANIGHTLAAAGVSGFLKALLSLKHKQLPPVASYQQQNEHIDLTNTPFYVNTQLQDWPQGEHPRRATVSSFAFSGTNAHMVLQEAPVRQSLDVQAQPHLVVLSARSEEQLAQQIQQLAAYLNQPANAQTNLLALSYSLMLGRKHFAYRAAFVVNSVSELCQMLAQALNQAPSESAGNKLTQANFYLANTRDKQQKAAFTAGCDKAQLNAHLQAMRAGEAATPSLLTTFAQAFSLGLFNGDSALFVNEIGNNTLVRLSLPTYPFAKESYWFKPFDEANRADAKSAKSAVSQTNSRTTDISPSLFRFDVNGEGYYSEALAIASVQQTLAAQKMQAALNGKFRGWAVHNLDLNAVLNGKLVPAPSVSDESSGISPFEVSLNPKNSHPENSLTENSFGDKTLDFTLRCMATGQQTHACASSVVSEALSKLDVTQIQTALQDAPTSKPAPTLGVVRYPESVQSLKALSMGALGASNVSAKNQQILVNIRVPHGLIGQQDIELACCFDAVIQACNAYGLASAKVGAAENTYFSVKAIGELAAYAPLETVMWAVINVQPRVEGDSEIDGEMRVNVSLCDANGNIRAQIQQLCLQPITLAHMPVSENDSPKKASPEKPLSQKKLSEKPSKPLDWMLLAEEVEAAPHAASKEAGIDWSQAVTQFAGQSVWVLYQDEAEKDALKQIAEALLTHGKESVKESESTALLGWQFLPLTSLASENALASLPADLVENAPNVVLLLGDSRTDEAATYRASSIGNAFAAIKLLQRRFWDSAIRGYYVFAQNAQQNAVDLQALSGLLSTASMENRRHQWKSLNFIDEQPARRAQWIMQELLADTLQPNQELFVKVRFQQGERYLERLRIQDNNTLALPSPDASSAVPAPAFKTGGTYLLVGGLGPIGELVCQHLASQYQANIVIVSRGDLNATKQAQIQALTAMGARVHYEQADVTHEPALAAAMQRILSQFSTINGVILLANQVQDEIVVNKQWNDFHTNIQTKIQSCLLLDKHTQTQPLDCFLMFSSIAAFGIPGSCDYAYGSAFQNAFAQHRNRLAKRGLRHGFASSLCWGPWTVDYYLRQEQAAGDDTDRMRKFAQQGTDLITLDAAVSVFDNANLANAPVVGAVAVADRQTFLKVMGLQAEPETEQVPVTETANTRVSTATTTTTTTTTTTSTDDPVEAQISQWEQALEKGEWLDINRVKSGLSMDEIKVMPPALIHRLHSVLSACQQQKTPAPVAETPVSAPSKTPTEIPTETSGETPEVSDVVAQTVATVLELNDIDHEETFQNYGMDSIVAMQLVTRLEKQLKVDIQPSWLVDFPTVASFSEHLENQKVSV
ncbi:MupA/Atu3671 family FMN-dependent luciferase-like monooxygenase [Alteromonas sp. a30]|uniref:MupA/Atu3671 family FMN-dependent luciferase-like monooxygenase n=1 Tax=Alteromonas sp. a30 TaxID=2730917 RepID=UPI002280E5A0|nr:MupA/Atu3671 family FMN-dependent luciferase-like monooxygenase [Alteromonas sp. a30]